MNVFKKLLAIFKPNQSALIAFGLGGALVLAHAPVAFAPVALVALGGLFWLWHGAKSVFHSVQLGLWFGLGFFGAGVSWLISSIYIYANVNLLLAIFATFIFVLFLSLYIAFAGWLAYRLQDRGIGITWVVIMPAIWVLAEWLRATLFEGFPFLLTGNTHIHTWLDGYAPVFGVLGMSWAVAATAGLVLWLYLSRAWLAASTALASIWLVGAGLQTIEWVKPVGTPIDVALLQGNVPQDKKWLKDAFMPTLKTYVDMTKKNLDADLVVWPETAVPSYYDLVEKGALKSFIKDAQLLETDILIGVITRNKDTGSYYNALVNVHNPEQQYQKHHLVPFSEFFPFGVILKPLSELFDVPYAEFTAGSETQKPLVLADQPAGLSICYEMAFGEELARTAGQARYLVTVSNDAWFANTLEPAQQVQDAQMRALELGREIARATNTGHTLVLDVKGNIKARLPAYQEGVLRAKVQPYEGETFFVQWKQTPLLTLLALAFGGILYRQWRARQNSN